MKIFLTGGSGFIGSNFILNYINTGDIKILNFDKLTYAGNNDNLISIKNHPNYKFVKGDICSKSAINRELNKFGPNVIINFAAESHVDRSIDSPMDFIKTNIVGTTNLLNECLKYWGKKKHNEFRFLHISTDEVYGSLEDNQYFTEESSYLPSSPYSASKASSDHLVRAWQITYGLPTIITNCSNNYGPYQFPEKLIPLMIANCIDEKTLPVYGNGLNVRDWLYVGDHCNAIYKVLLDGKVGETYNIGGNNDIKNIDIVETICKKLDKLNPRKNGKSYQELITYVTDRPGHDHRYAIDASKIRKDLGWVPKETFDSGISKTIQWYLENINWWRKIQGSNYKQERLGLKKK